MTVVSKRENISHEEYLKELDAHCRRAEREPLYWLIAILAVMALGIFALFLSTWASQAARAATGAREAMRPMPKMTGLQAFATAAFVPYLFAAGALVLGAAAWALTAALRCPHCRRFFPRGKLRLYDQHERSVPELDGVGGVRERMVRTSVYWTECRHCGKVILVHR
ncbi:MAG: hypothetical protein MUF78_09665 [Candidatus Edwardsbacteria bacterium]|jgi:hypothetical protein|nr:hypothetical protein [Candidatus Edwardsbacteria bacterium]